MLLTLDTPRRRRKPLTCAPPPLLSATAVSSATSLPPPPLPLPHRRHPNPALTNRHSQHCSAIGHQLHPHFAYGLLGRRPAQPPGVVLATPRKKSNQVHSAASSLSPRNANRGTAFDTGAAATVIPSLANDAKKKKKKKLFSTLQPPPPPLPSPVHILHCGSAASRAVLPGFARTIPPAAPIGRKNRLRATLAPLNGEGDDGRRANTVFSSSISTQSPALFGGASEDEGG